MAGDYNSRGLILLPRRNTTVTFIFKIFLLMSQQVVCQLPAETIKLITSSQIITSVSTAVKELVENSIDAGAKFIQVRLENYGWDLIEVKDDGFGVSYDNVQKMFLPGFTSKIRKFEDLDDLTSYGFRGEALAALCKISKISVTTKTPQDALAMIYSIDSSGFPTSSKPSHVNNGTIISVSDLFFNLPVRRLYLTSKKKLSEELKKTEHVLQSLSLIHPNLQVCLFHNKSSIWRKNSVKDIKQSFMQVVGLRVVSKMEYLKKSVNQISIDLMVPKKSLDDVEHIFSSSSNNVYTYVNKRPIVSKKLFQPVQEHIFHHFSNLVNSQKFSACLVSIEVSPQQIDINLEPNKTKAILKNETEIIKILDEMLSDYYEQKDFTCNYLKNLIPEDVTVVEEEPEEKPAKRPKIDKSIGERRNEIFKEKNQEWTLEIINDDCEINSKPLSLCSQINNTNSVLTCEEISEFNAIRTEKNVNLITSANSKNSETRLVDRNDIQSRVLEKPILEEWPRRQIPQVAEKSSEVKSREEEGIGVEETQPEVLEKSSSEVENKMEVTLIGETQEVGGLSEVENKKVEEIAVEIEKEAEMWSKEVIKAIKTDGDEVVEVDKDENLEEEAEKFDLSMQSVSSQMGKKELKAFTKFARLMRPKITEEFPNLIFTQVAKILAERWRSLTSDEVKYYEKLAEVVETNRKSHKEEKESKPIKKPSKSVAELMKLKSKITRPPRKEVPFEISMSSVKRLSNWSPCSKEEYCAVGQLEPSGNWIYKKGEELGHIRHQGLKELITSQKMLSTLEIPRRELEKPIMLSEEVLGSDLWNVLISLDCRFDQNSSKYLITDDVITKNGFSVEVIMENGAVSSGRILEVASCIPHFGLWELKDALSLYLKTGEIGGLASWRPTAVSNYITNEAIRTSHQESDPPTAEEMKDLLNTYNLCLRHLPPLCLHSKEIFPPIYVTESKVRNN